LRSAAELGFAADFIIAPFALDHRVNSNNLFNGVAGEQCRIRLPFALVAGRMGIAFISPVWAEQDRGDQ
jgi:hypothetical protein